MRAFVPLLVLAALLPAGARAQTVACRVLPTSTGEVSGEAHLVCVRIMPNCCDTALADCGFVAEPPVECTADRLFFESPTSDCWLGERWGDALFSWVGTEVTRHGGGFPSGCAVRRVPVTTPSGGTIYVKGACFGPCTEPGCAELPQACPFPDACIRGDAPCEAGRMCAFADECASGVCLGAECIAPSCTDSVLNGDEADVDCGGSCPRCRLGESCRSAGDCASMNCDPAASVCAAECDDGIRNADESDIDCGGGCPACDDGEGCESPTDCVSGRCVANLCMPALADAGAAEDAGVVMADDGGLHTPDAGAIDPPDAAEPDPEPTDVPLQAVGGGNCACRAAPSSDASPIVPWLVGLCLALVFRSRRRA